MSVFSKDVSDEVAEYYKLLTSDDESTRLRAARCWSLWEFRTSTLLPDEESIQKIFDDNIALSVSRIECHFFVNNIFFEENFILDNTDKIKSIKTHIVHGRYDAICPMENAFELDDKLDNSTLHIIDDAGHGAGELNISKKLVNIMDTIR